MTLTMFLETDQEQAKKELDVYQYSMESAIIESAKANFNKVAMHLENAKRSAEELQQLKNKKTAYSEAIKKLEAINGSECLK